MSIRLWLDDLRPHPDGWTRAYTLAEAIEILDRERENLTELWIDNDLGDGAPEGWRIADWLCEQHLFPPTVLVGTDNAARLSYIAGTLVRYGGYTQAGRRLTDPPITSSGGGAG